MKISEKLKDWMLDRYCSIEQVFGIWVPSRYAEEIRLIIFALFLLFVILGSMIFLFGFLPE
jgi:hypothetical protein